MDQQGSEYGTHNASWSLEEPYRAHTKPGGHGLSCEQRNIGIEPATCSNGSDCGGYSTWRLPVIPNGDSGGTMH
ncbi:MAG TPA: hypothetical protein VKB84_21445 [Candidatus Binataceae bacterium]|nr:hypothetical protein [Candidatus Binataceae bacterium]